MCVSKKGLVDFCVCSHVPVHVGERWGVRERVMGEKDIFCRYIHVYMDV